MFSSVPQTPSSFHAAATRTSCSLHQVLPATRKSLCTAINTLSVTSLPRATGTTLTRTAFTSLFPTPVGARLFGVSSTVNGSARPAYSFTTSTALMQTRYFPCSRSTTSLHSAHRLQCTVSSSRRISANSTSLPLSTQPLQARLSTQRYTISSSRLRALSSWRALVRPRPLSLSATLSA